MPNPWLAGLVVLMSMAYAAPSPAALNVAPFVVGWCDDDLDGSGREATAKIRPRGAAQDRRDRDRDAKHLDDMAARARRASEWARFVDRGLVGSPAETHGSGAVLGGIRTRALNAAEAEEAVGIIWSLIEKLDIATPSLSLTADSDGRMEIYFRFGARRDAGLVRAELLNLATARLFRLGIELRCRPGRFA